MIQLLISVQEISLTLEDAKIFLISTKFIVAHCSLKVKDFLEVSGIIAIIYQQTLTASFCLFVLRHLQKVSQKTLTVSLFIFIIFRSFLILFYPNFIFNNICLHRSSHISIYRNLFCKCLRDILKNDNSSSVKRFLFNLNYF